MFDRISKASSSAFKFMDSLSPKRDEDVELYEALKPEDFDGLTKEFGIDNVSDYITEMEKRRAKGR